MTDWDQMVDDMDRARACEQALGVVTERELVLALALERIEFLTARSGQSFQEKINQIAREALAAQGDK